MNIHRKKPRTRILSLFLQIHLDGVTRNAWRWSTSGFINRRYFLLHTSHVERVIRTDSGHHLTQLLSWLRVWLGSCAVFPGAVSMCRKGIANKSDRHPIVRNVSSAAMSAELAPVQIGPPMWIVIYNSRRVGHQAVPGKNDRQDGDRAP